MSSGRPVDDALSKNHIDEAIKALLSRITLNTKYWIPYLAGYSRNWKTNPVVYIDPRLPEILSIAGKRVHIYRYLIIHECVEKTLMDELGLPYDIAHDFATAAEKSAVEADGFSWDAYTRALNPYIKQAVTKPDGLEAPQDLDLAPYEQDHSKDLGELQKEAPQTQG